MQGIHWDEVDPNQKHMWSIFALVKTVLSGDVSVRREGSSLNAEVSLGPWVGGSWSLRNVGPEFPCFTAVDVEQNKELRLG